MDRFAEIKNKLLQYAAEDENIRGVIAIGSSAREDVPADIYSDLDLIIVTKNPEQWFSGEYPRKVGKVSVSFIEPTLGGGKERRCIFDDDKDVDMIIFTPDQMKNAFTEGVAEWVMNRGYHIYYDTDGYAEFAEKYVRPVIVRNEMKEEEFQNLVNDFYFHNIWAYKKLLRGELWSAKMCTDAYLKQHLLKMIEQYHLVLFNTKENNSIEKSASDNTDSVQAGMDKPDFDQTDVWHDGRFLDRWAESAVLEELKNCFAHYEKEDCRAALFATHKLFARLSEAVAEKKGYSYPEEAKMCARRFFESN